MNYLNIVADEVKDYDPQGRPVTMYNPNHRGSSELATVTNQGLDWTMMGVYATAEPFDSRGPRIANGVDRIVTAAESVGSVAVPADAQPATVAGVARQTDGHGRWLFPPRNWPGSVQRPSFRHRCATGC